MDYKFFLDELEIEEPIGWADFELSMQRDDVYHGMQFEVSTGALRFFGAAARYLMDQKELNGLKSNVIFIAQENCDGEYGGIVEGRLNFGKYKERCGGLCIVEIPFEEEGCKVTFKNRFDQKVDIDSMVALDNTTVLPDYAQLGQTITIPAKALQAAVDGSVGDSGYQATISYDAPVGVTDSIVFLRPDYDIERYNNILTGQLIGGNNCQSVSTVNFTDCLSEFITPQLLFEDSIDCFDGNFTYSSRKKGSLSWAGIRLRNVQQKIIKWDGIGNIYDDGEVVAEGGIFFVDAGEEGPDSIFFDSTLTGTTTIEDGIGFYAVLEVGVIMLGADGNVAVNFDQDTYFTLEAIKICPDSESQYYMIHEALSRVTEAITNKCIRVKSEYYGRIDSQPFAFDADGCGSLRMITGGLKLRKAPDAKFFISAKELIGGLNAIDNIGFAIEPDDTIEGRMLLIIEPIARFYQDFEVLSLDSIQEVVSEIQEGMHYAKIQTGYKKWEVEQVNGLNEFNSTREYRTGIETINTTLDIQSNLVAGSYPIELTRQQSFAASGAADTTYDTEAFIICLVRSAYDFQVERDNILNSANIFDPATVMNFRISPVRNLLRWFKSIINSYVNISTAANKLYFNAGTGNYTAAGLLDDASACRLENATIAENADLGMIAFANQGEATPLFKNETAAFEYPLSIAQFKHIKANPYGYIAYTCGQSPTAIKAFIKEIKFRPARGMANFILRKKWN